LGLAIVARIITEHGGLVYAEANVPTARGLSLNCRLVVSSGTDFSL